MMAEGDGSTQQYYALILRDKSDGAEGIRRAKGAAVVRLLGSMRYANAVVCCNELEDSHWLESVLNEAGLHVSNIDRPSKMPGVSGNQVAGPLQIHVIAGRSRDSTNTGFGILLVYLDVPNEGRYLESVRQPSSSRAIVTYVTPLELVVLKGFTQPDPEAKIKPLPEVLPGLNTEDKEDQQTKSAEPSSVTTSLELTQGSNPSAELAPFENKRAAQEQMETDSQAEELQRRKEELLRSLDALRPHQNGSAAAKPAALSTAEASSQNGHDPSKLEPVSIAAIEDDEVPPPPLGSPRPSPAATGAIPGMLREALLPVRTPEPTSALQYPEEGCIRGAEAEKDTSPEAVPAQVEGAGRRGRQRSAQEAAARKEEQQELALERAILEIHWQQAESGEDIDFDFKEAEELTGDADREEGELAGQGVSIAEEQPAAGAGAGPAWHQHLPAFYQQWGRSAADSAPASAGGEHAKDGAGGGEEASAEEVAWEEWYRLQGYAGQDAPSQQGGAAASADKAGEDVWQQWNRWQQQQSSWGGSAPNVSSWDAAGQAGASSGGPFSWAPQVPQGKGQEGYVSVPFALLQRYQMLEWAEWCRQYERWQAAYEQWYSWWSSQMWQASGYYGASTGQDASAS